MSSFGLFDENHEKSRAMTKKEEKRKKRMVSL